MISLTDGSASSQGLRDNSCRAGHTQREQEVRQDPELCTLCSVPRCVWACVRTCICPSRKLWSRVPSCLVGGETVRSRLNPSHLSPFLLCCELLSFTAMRTIVGSLAKPWLFLSITRPVPRRKERPEAALDAQTHIFQKTQKPSQQLQTCLGIWEHVRRPTRFCVLQAAPGFSRMPVMGTSMSLGSSARPAFSLPSHSPTPTGKEVFSLPWRRTDS